MSYDPRACGARCDVCPLGPNGSHRTGAWQPVAPEMHEGATILAVAEMPGHDEASFGRPLSGRSGSEWNLALLAAGKNVLERDRPTDRAAGDELRQFIGRPHGLVVERHDHAARRHAGLRSRQIMDDADHERS